MNVPYVGLGAKIASVLLVVGLISVPVVAAQTSPASAPSGSTLDQRVQQRKNERNVALDTRAQQRLITSCINAQTKISAIQQDTATMLSERSAAYQKIEAKLWIVIGSLKLASKDTGELEKVRTSYAEKTKAFLVTGQNYRQTLDDATAVNCKSDPTGFQALLDTARLYNVQLKEQSADIRKLVTGDIKQSLASAANDLQSQQTDSEESGS